MTPQSKLKSVNENVFDKENLNSFSSSFYGIRKVLFEQFNRIEKDLHNKFKETHERFATKEELFNVLSKIHEFRSEIEKTIGGIEEVGYENSSEDLLSGVNLFNLRKRYHQFSLRNRSEEVDAFGYDPIFDKFISPLFEFLYYKYWRVETYGVSNIPSSGRVLLVGNHAGALPYDATMLKVALQKEHTNHRDIRFMVEDFLYHFPFLGSLMNRFGGVRASQENAQELINKEHAVIVFPEGVKGLGKLYRDRYHLARFGRGGFIRLCLRTGAPLVPVVFIGSEDIHPIIAKDNLISKAFGVPYIPFTWTFPWLGPLGIIPLPSKWSIHILPPIDFSQYGPDAEKDRVLIYKLANQVKDQIQETIIDKLKNRRSIWFG